MRHTTPKTTPYRRYITSSYGLGKLLHIRRRNPRHHLHFWSKHKTFSNCQNSPLRSGITCQKISDEAIYFRRQQARSGIWQRASTVEGSNRRRRPGPSSPKFPLFESDAIVRVRQPDGRRLNRNYVLQFVVPGGGKRCIRENLFLN